MEEMGAFFDARVEGYRAHMADLVEDLDRFYSVVASRIEMTEDPVTVLDLGCASGAELEAIFVRAPRARVTAVDLSAGMLAELARHFATRAGDQVTIVQDSFIGMEFESASFDYVLSVFAMHHFTPAIKLGLYQKIRRWLRPTGAYLEGDTVVTPEQVPEIERWYSERYTTDHLKEAHDPAERVYHFDIPCTVDTQLELLSEAGFGTVELLWRERDDCAAIFAAR